MKKTFCLLFCSLTATVIMAQDNDDYKSYYNISPDKKILYYEDNFDAYDQSVMKIDIFSSDTAQKVGIGEGVLLLLNTKDGLFQINYTVKKMKTEVITAEDDWEIETSVEYENYKLLTGKWFFGFNYNDTTAYQVGFYDHETHDFIVGNWKTGEYKDLWIRHTNWEGYDIKHGMVTLRKQGDKLHLFINGVYEYSMNWNYPLSSKFGYGVQSGRSIKIDYLRIYKIIKESDAEFMATHPAATYHGLDNKKTVLFDDNFDDNHNGWDNKIAKGNLVLKGINNAEKKIMTEDIPDFEFEAIMLGDSKDRIFEIYGEEPLNFAISFSIYNNNIRVEINNGYKDDATYYKNVYIKDENTPSKFTVRKYKDLWYFFYDEKFIYCYDQPFVPVHSVKFWSYSTDKLLVDKLTFSKISR